MRKYLYPTLLFVFIGIILLAIGMQINSGVQASDLSSRLMGLGVPVISVKTISAIPFNIDISLQSTSDNTELAYGDIWNMALADREATFNYRIGSRIASYTVSVYNSKGNLISSGTTTLYPQAPYQQLPSGMSKLSNQQTEGIIKDNLKLGNFSIDKMTVLSLNASGDNGQILDIQLSSKNASEADEVTFNFSPLYS